MDIYITGRYNAEAFKLQYACYATERSSTFICDELLGSRPETELRVVQQALQYAYKGKRDVTIHTDFANIQKRINGRIKATSQSAKDFAAFASMVREQINVRVVEEIPARERKALDYILDNLYNELPRDRWKSCTVTWAPQENRKFLAQESKQPENHPVTRERDWFCCIDDNCGKPNCLDCLGFNNCDNCLGSICNNLCIDCVRKIASEGSEQSGSQRV